MLGNVPKNYEKNSCSKRLIVMMDTVLEWGEYRNMKLKDSEYIYSYKSLTADV